MPERHERTGRGTHRAQQPVAPRRSDERRTGGRLTKPGRHTGSPSGGCHKPFQFKSGRRPRQILAKKGVILP
jgi:hypothetical protein